MDDWIPQACGQALDRLGIGLEPRFTKKEWKEFSTRLANRFDELFRLTHRLYGQRFDFAWTLSELVEVAADGYLERKGRLKHRDRQPVSWIEDPATTWGMAYLDRYAKDAEGLTKRLPHLQSLGITHLHLLPPYLVPEGANDGGYAVSDYRTLRPDLGTMKDLRRAIRALEEAGIGVVLDLICNHTSSDHRWAQAARAGNPEFVDFYFFFPDRSTPDALSPQLRSIFPDRGGDAFTWNKNADSGSWVWTTFYPFQWDLNYRNPRVLAAMSREMLFLANLGLAAIRMDATPFMWKEAGTASENRPEAHVLLRIMRILADLACPSVQFLSEAIVHPDQVKEFVNPGECQLGYNPLLMSSLWDALATGDVRFLDIALGERSQLPSGCSWLTYLRSHDDVGWGFADEDAHALGVDPVLHRKYLNAFYSGAFPGSFARGQLFQENPLTGDARISGTLASLAGLEQATENLDSVEVDAAVARILAAWAIALTAGGLPLISFGDETAVLSDYSYLADPHLAGDNRWSHRRGFEPKRWKTAVNGEGAEGQVYLGLIRLLELRRSFDLTNTVPPQPFETGDRGTVGFHRGPITVLANLGRQPAVINTPERRFDLYRGEPWESNHLAPSEFRILS